MPEKKRIVFLDYLRVIACFMVIVIHVTECYYCTPDGAVIASEANRWWIAVVNSLCRAAVPLFVMASSYLLLPLPYSAGVFFRKRFVRVLIPFIFWLVMYAVLPPFLMDDTGWNGLVANAGRIMYNFTDTSGHLWFIYMLMGVYCLMPVISPWLQTVSKRGEQIFLAIWFLSTFMHYAKALLGGSVIGEAIWNEFHALYYYSGYIGYIVLAHYIRTYINWSPRKSLAIGIPCFLVGFAITAGVFFKASLATTDYYIVELSWRFCTFNVALQAFGLFIMFRHIGSETSPFYPGVRKVSALSYGMYLMHIFILSFMFRIISPLLGTPATILSVSIATFACCIAVAALLRRLPGGKYIIG